MTFGENLYDARKRAKKTQVQLAKRLGITYQAVSQWERDETFPDHEKLPFIARELNTTIGKLMEGVDDLSGFEAELLAAARKVPPDQRPQALRVVRAFSNE